jgi:hypothetical protein
MLLCRGATDKATSMAGITDNDIELYPNTFNFNTILKINKPEVIKKFKIFDFTGNQIKAFEKSSIKN